MTDQKAARLKLAYAEDARGMAARVVRQNTNATDDELVAKLAEEAKRSARIEDELLRAGVEELVREAAERLAQN